jgi:hypothetical protein
MVNQGVTGAGRSVSGEVVHDSTLLIDHLSFLTQAPLPDVE